VAPIWSLHTSLFSYYVSVVFLPCNLFFGPNLVIAYKSLLMFCKCCVSSLYIFFSLAVVFGCLLWKTSDPFWWCWCPVSGLRHYVMMLLLFRGIFGAMYVLSHCSKKKTQWDPMMCCTWCRSKILVFFVWCSCLAL